MSITAQETTSGASSPPVPPAAPKWFAALGLVAGLGAVVASSCCVVPLGLAALGAGAGVLGGLEAIAPWRAPLLSISGFAIAGGWGAWWFKRRPAACASGGSCASPKRSPATLALLLCASMVVLAAASWGYIDPVLLKLFRGR